MKVPKLMIATPCYGGQMFYNYMNSVLGTIIHLNKKNIEVKLVGMGNESLITRARNQLSAEFLSSDCTHLLFIDADITWFPPDVEKLLNWNKDLIGGVYPMKDYHFENAEEAMKASYNKDGKFNAEMFKSKLMRYPVNFKEGQKNIEVNKGLIKVKNIPTGFMLIKREVFEKMIKKQIVQKLTQDSNRDKRLEPYLYNFFDCDVDKKGHYLSEDYAFCMRYLNLDVDNNEIFADISIQLSHTGTHTFHGHYGLSLLSESMI